ncbi:MAG: hypothetical protein FWD14_05665 [Treponema sp.]|nr:hypothetical protein [Treponema sp.]
MTITQTVDITDSRRLHIDFDVPREIPAGKAQVELKVIPFKKEEKPEPPLKCLIGVETPLADSLLGVAANLGNITLDEIREERLTKYPI